jgi:hypothetical protein
MTSEPTEGTLAKCTAHAMRIAAMRLALERAGQDADPSLTYGCVDWFRYDAASPPQEPDTAVPPKAARPGAPRDGASSGH